MLQLVKIPKRPLESEANDSVIPQRRNNKNRQKQFACSVIPQLIQCGSELDSREFLMLPCCCRRMRVTLSHIQKFIHEQRSNVCCIKKLRVITFRRDAPREEL